MTEHSELRPENRYQRILGAIFERHYVPGATRIPWERDEMIEVSAELGIEVPKNLGDVVYSVRYRTEISRAITEATPAGYNWIIYGAGKGKYVFELTQAQARIVPNPNLTVIKVPDSTPEIILKAALGDEQALLALVRYNRLVDIFLGITANSLQNHLRTTAKGIGQVEIDEIYVGLDQWGRQFIVPVQAKGGNDEIGIVQIRQDLAVCAEKWPDMIPRAVAVQFAANERIAVFELTVQDNQIRIRREQHYQLVTSEKITADDLREYQDAAPDDLD